MEYGEQLYDLDHGARFLRQSTPVLEHPCPVPNSMEAVWLQRVAAKNFVKEVFHGFGGLLVQRVGQLALIRWRRGGPTCFIHG